MLAWSGHEVEFADLAAIPLKLNGVPKAIGTPFAFLEAMYELVGFGVKANGITGDIRPVNNADHLALVHNRSFL